MGYRYCDGCERWLETSEYTVSDSGETICEEHGSVSGFIIDAPWSTSEYKRQNPKMWDEALSAARQQGLVR